MRWGNVLQKEIVQPGLGPFLWPSVFSCVCEIQEIQSTVQRIFKCHLICYNFKSITAAGDRILLRCNSKECFLLFTLKSWSVYFPPQPPVPIFMRSELRSDGPDSASDIVIENEQVANTEEYIMYIAKLHFSW